MTAPNPEGVSRCIQAALADARIGPREVDAINGHLTATSADPKEVHSWATALGCSPSDLPPITSTKSMIGHLLGAAGGVEAIFCILAIRDQVAPPTINLDEPGEGCDLDYVPGQARDWKIDNAISNSLGFGGHNVCLLFGRHDG